MIVKQIIYYSKALPDRGLFALTMLVILGNACIDGIRISDECLEPLPNCKVHIFCLEVSGVSAFSFILFIPTSNIAPIVQAVLISITATAGCNL